MCTIKEKLDLNEFTGYKYVITDKYGHHYSPYTGIRYKVGDVPKLKLKQKLKYIVSEFCFNKEQHENRLTGVFVDISTCEKNALHDKRTFQRYYKLKDQMSIIELTIGGDLYDGDFCGKIVCGDKINKIKLIKKL